MARPPRFSTRRLPESLRSRIDVATSLAWEALVETHVAQATTFVTLLEDRMPLEESLPRYLLEVDLTEAMTSAVRSRVLAAVEPEQSQEPPTPAPIVLRPEGAEPQAEEPPEDDEDAGWRRFRPDVVVRELRERQKRDDHTESMIRLALARAEEVAIATHVDNAISFVALLDGVAPVDRAVQAYLQAVGLSGGRGQSVHQRTMARLADVHLPLPPSPRPRPRGPTVS